MIPLARLASKLPTRQLNATGREVVSQTNKFHGGISRENFTGEFHGRISRENFTREFHARISRENFTVTCAVGNVVDVNSMLALAE